MSYEGIRIGGSFTDARWKHTSLAGAAGSSMSGGRANERKVAVVGCCPLRASASDILTEQILGTPCDCSGINESVSRPSIGWSSSP